MLISFAIIAYNEERNIRRLIDSILAQDRLADHDYEIIVVNDGSRDRTAALVRQAEAELPGVRLIDLPQNRGRGFARATVIDAAKGDLIATIDADTVLPPHWLATCLAALDGYDAVGGTAVPDGDAAYVYSRFRLEPRVVSHTMTLTGNNALYRRTVFDRVGFDPDLRDGEDIALNHEIGGSPLRTRGIEGLTVRHEENKSFAEVVAFLFITGRGASRQLLRYRQLRMPDVAYGVFALLALAALAAAWRWPIALLLPAAYVVASAVMHIRSRFVLRPGQAFAGMGAIGVDCVLLTAYYVGRTVGLLKGFDPAWRRIPQR